LSGRRLRPEEPAPESAGADQNTVNISVFQSRLPSRFTDPCAQFSGSRSFNGLLKKNSASSTAASTLHERWGSIQAAAPRHLDHDTTLEPPSWKSQITGARRENLDLLLTRNSQLGTAARTLGFEMIEIDQKKEEHS
jgi:hypothetical protein